MMGNFKIIAFKEKVTSDGLTKELTQDSGKTIICMVKGLSLGLMVESTLVTFSKVDLKDKAASNGLMAEST